MIMTTLCYVEEDGKYLMLHRNKKKADMNEGKWIGIGGKFEEGETPEECILREAKEETGLTLTKLHYRGLITFAMEGKETEYMHLFTASEYEGVLTECKEGTLRWIDKNEVCNLNLWEGDKVFLQLLEERHEYFSLKLSYRGDDLVEAHVF